MGDGWSDRSLGCHLEQKLAMLTFLAKLIEGASDQGTASV